MRRHPSLTCQILQSVCEKGLEFWRLHLHCKQILLQKAESTPTTVKQGPRGVQAPQHLGTSPTTHLRDKDACTTMAFKRDGKERDTLRFYLSTQTLICCSGGKQNSDSPWDNDNYVCACRSPGLLWKHLLLCSQREFHCHWTVLGGGFQHKCVGCRAARNGTVVLCRKCHSGIFWSTRSASERVAAACGSLSAPPAPDPCAPEPARLCDMGVSP